MKYIYIYVTCHICYIYIYVICYVMLSLIFAICADNSVNPWHAAMA